LIETIRARRLRNSGSGRPARLADGRNDAVAEPDQTRDGERGSVQTSHSIVARLPIDPD
jgi:hypothetical protein